MTEIVRDIDYINNPFDRPARPTRENGAAYNTNFGDAVYRTPRDATSRRLTDSTMKYADLDKENLIHAPTDETHYGNNFVKKFLNQEFADDYDIGKSGVFRSQDDIDRDTINIIKQIEENNRVNVDKNSVEHKQRMAYYEDMINNPSRTTFNYDFKGMQQLLDLITLRKQGISYNPELTTLDSVQSYIDRINNNRGHRLYGGKVFAEDLDYDFNILNNIIILNNKDLLAFIDGSKLNYRKKNLNHTPRRLNYPFKYHRDALRGTAELKAFNAYYNLPLSLLAQNDSPVAWAETVKRKTGNPNYFQPSIYVTLESKILDFWINSKLKIHMV
jgi:hypothetical protein